MTCVISCIVSVLESQGTAVSDVRLSIGFVLMPGVILPLCLFHSEVLAVDLALEAASPLSGIIIVVGL